MPFNEDYKATMEAIKETGNEAAQVYAEYNQKADNNGEKSGVDWGGLVNGFAAAAKEWAESRNNGGRRWNDFKVEVDEGTQKTVLWAVAIIAGAIIFWAYKQANQ